MDTATTKCVMVLDESLPLGLLANTAAIMGITLGKRLPEAVGPDVTDGSGRAHLGIIALPVPVLRADGERIRAIREALFQPEYKDMLAVDFSDVAQGCHVYEEYTERIARVQEADLRYFGIALCGPKKLVNRLTGSLPLLR